MSVFVHFLEEIGRILIFGRDLWIVFRNHPPRSREVFLQIWKVTVDSFSTTAMAGFFVGAILSVQFTLQMKEFGTLGYLGGLATSGTFREVGPLLIAFMLSGKVGAYTAAELGTMRVTEQIDAVRCLGANPLQEILLPRLLAIVISSFFLLGLGLWMSVLGGMLMGSIFAGVTYEEYLRHIPTLLSGFSIFGGLIKCLIFSIILGLLCTYKGYFVTGGSKGVGRAVVSTAVTTMVSIVIFDWITSYLNNIAFEWMSRFL